MAKSEKLVGKDRVNELTKEIKKIQEINNTLLQRGQSIQQQMAQNNTQILKLQGAIEEAQR